MTAAGTFLGWANFVDQAYVLAVEGVGLMFTTRPEVAELGAVWSAATGGEWGPELYGGLVIQGSIERSIEMFDARIDASQLRFSILDYQEILGPLMFAEARTDIRRAFLSEPLAPAGTELHVLDLDAVNELPGLGPIAGVVHVGLEAMVRTALTGTFYWTVTRGKWSLFGTDTAAPFARYHDVGEDADDAPEITSIPTIWVNRRVGLYACPRIGASFAAGFPGTVPNDAELMWAGVIKHPTDGGDGWIHLDCEEVSGLMKTTVGARVYGGTLEEGSRFESIDEEIQFTLRLIHYPVGGGAPDATYGGAVYINTLALTGSRLSHADVATLINAELAVILTGANDGVYAPAGMTGELSLETEPDGSQRYHLFFTWDDVPATGHIEGFVYLSLSPQVWLLLGMNRDRVGLRRNSTGDGHVAYVACPQSDLPSIFRVVASDLPMRFTVRMDADGSVGQEIDVTPDTAIAFEPQTILPVGLPGDVEGFLRLNEGPIVAVKQTATNKFAVRGLLGQDFRRNLGQGGSIVGGRDDLDLSGVLHAQDEGGPALKVNQAWVQPFAGVGDALLTLLASTGSPDFNLVDYDTLPHGFGLAIPASLLDAAEFTALPAVPYLLVLEKPKPAAQMLEAAFNVMGRHLVWRGGRFTLGDPLAEPPSGIVQLDETNKVTIFSQGSAPQFVPTPIERNPETIINQITLKHTPQPDGSFRHTEVVKAVRSMSEHGQAKNLVIDGWGFFAAGAAYWRANVAPGAIFYYSRPIAAGMRPVTFRLAVGMAPSDQAVVVDPFVRDPRTGLRGVTDLVVWIVSVTIDLMTGIADLRYVFAPHALRVAP